MNVPVVITGAGVLVALLSIVVNIWQYRRGKRYKELSHEKSSSFSVFSIQEEYKENVTISYRDRGATERTVSSIYAIELRIYNTGTEPISLPGRVDGNLIGSELEQPVTLDFGNTEILSARVSDTKPQGKQVSVAKETVEQNSSEKAVVVLKPVMLNAGDSVSIITLLAETPANEPQVYATIEGVQLRESTPAESTAAKTAQRIVLGIIIGFVIGLVGTSVVLLLLEFIFGL